MSSDRDEFLKKKLKKETGLRHPLKKIEPKVQPSRREEKIETKTSNSIKPKKVIKKALGLLKNLTPVGTAASAIKIVRENAKRAERKLNNERLNPGKTPKPMKTGGMVPSGFPNDSYRARLTSGEVVLPKPPDPYSLESILGKMGGTKNKVSLEGNPTITLNINSNNPNMTIDSQQKKMIQDSIVDSVLRIFSNGGDVNSMYQSTSGKYPSARKI